MRRRNFLKSGALAACSCLVLPQAFSMADTRNYSWTGKKIIFLGDSITQAGDYINFFESTLIANSGIINFNTELLKLGLASETISGLSEEAHPFPRPYLHERLERVMAATSPDMVFACYGINCGIYHPFSDAFFRQYQQGVERLIKAVEGAGAELILMTPPPYAAPVDDWDQAHNDEGRNDYGYISPYLAYDDVMRRYAEWILSLEGKVKVIDLQTPMRRFQHLCYDQDFIHPNKYGHQLMAVSMLDALNLEDDNKVIKMTVARSTENEPGDFGQVLRTGMPLVPHRQYTDDQEYNRLVAGTDLLLKLNDTPVFKSQLYDQHQLIGQYRANALSEGIRLNQQVMGTKLAKLSPWRLSEKIFDLISARRNIYDYSLLQHIGHKRPMSREGLPISLAEKKRDEIHTQLTALLDQKIWQLNLVKVR